MMFLMRAFSLIVIVFVLTMNNVLCVKLSLKGEHEKQEIANRIRGANQTETAKILGVSVSDLSDENVVKKAFRKLSLMFHPDKCNYDDAGAIFQKISTAYNSVNGSSSSGGSSSDEENHSQNQQQRNKMSKDEWAQKLGLKNFEEYRHVSKHIQEGSEFISFEAYVFFETYLSNKYYGSTSTDEHKFAHQLYESDSENAKSMGLSFEELIYMDNWARSKGFYKTDTPLKDYKDATKSYLRENDMDFETYVIASDIVQAKGFFNVKQFIDFASDSPALKKAMDECNEQIYSELGYANKEAYDQAKRTLVGVKNGIEIVSVAMYKALESYAKDVAGFQSLDLYLQSENRFRKLDRKLSNKYARSLGYENSEELLDAHRSALDRGYVSVEHMIADARNFEF